MREQLERAWARATARQRRLLAIAGILALVAIARCGLEHVSDEQLPKQLPDSGMFLQLAAEPLSWQHVYGPKPLLVPCVYRAIGGDPGAIAAVQEHLALGAWLLLGVVVAACVRRPRARVAAVVVALAFLLAPVRVGWADDLLSESINDSLAALLVAAAIALATASIRLPAGRRRSLARGLLATSLVVTSTAWMLTRDTNAVTALVACGVAAAVWRVGLRRDRWALALIAVTACTAGFVIHSAGVVPDRPAMVTPTGASWPRELSARNTFPMIDNLLVRVLPDDDARAYFVDHGLPQVQELAPFAGRWAGKAGPLFLSPAFAEARAWIASDATGTYARWLLRHPIARGDELVGHLFDVLAPRDLASYMPSGWDGGGVVRGITASESVLLVLILIAPFVLRHPRAHPITAIAVCLIASGIAGAAASYYGDAIEVGRHCWGSGQQIVLGLFLGIVAWLDRDRLTAPGRHVTVPPT